MQSVLLIVHIFISLALIGIILVQRSNNDGLGLTSGGGGSNNSFLSSRGQANLLTRATAVLAALFMLNCLVLAYIASHEGGENSLVNKVLEEQKNTPAGAVAPTENKAPAVPIAK